MRDVRRPGTGPWLRALAIHCCTAGRDAIFGWMARASRSASKVNSSGKPQGVCHESSQRRLGLPAAFDQGAHQGIRAPPALSEWDWHPVGPGPGPGRAIPGRGARTQRTRRRGRRRRSRHHRMQQVGRRLGQHIGHELPAPGRWESPGVAAQGRTGTTELADIARTPAPPGRSRPATAQACQSSGRTSKIQGERID